MKYAADFRKIAREALRGNWWNAALTSLVASLIGANIATGGNFDFSSNSSLNSTDQSKINEFIQPYLPTLLIVFAVLSIWALVTFIISGPTKLGYAKYNLNLVDKKPASISDLFSQFTYFGNGFCMNLLMSIYIVLWTLLFIVPGIIKSFSYAMTPYILAEHPELSANDAITESRRIMNGNKGRLFCLQFSFIGWELLSLIPMLILIPLIYMGTAGIILWAISSFLLLFIANLFIIPYREAAQAAFYRDITQIYIPTTPIAETPYQP